MTKITVDLEYIKVGLTDIGFEISNCIERDNNGKNWQIIFSNSRAVATIYDSNKTNNSVIGGKASTEEKHSLKLIVDGLKSKEITIDPLNKTIVKLIRSAKETDYYDFKLIPHKDNADLLHDILCLSNNLQNRDAYLIIGVSDNNEVVGLEQPLISNNILDFLKTIKFAGGHMPDIVIHNMYYKTKQIGVIEIKGSRHVPFYLSERYKGVYANQIYTRTGDTNTPKTSCASYADVEKLWQIHFAQ